MVRGMGEDSRAGMAHGLKPRSVTIGNEAPGDTPGALASSVGLNSERKENAFWFGRLGL